MRFHAFPKSLRESYWFVPALMVVIAVAASTCTVAIDGMFGSGEAARLKMPFAGGAEGARALLSTVAGSMITVAGVTFSITMVALTLTSSQFGPRLITNFMRDRGNQVVLGTFTATFLYCLLVLRTVLGPGEDVFVPQLSVTVALMLAFASIGVLIYFIHHVAVGIRAENIIAAIGAELDTAIETFAPAADPVGPEAPASEDHEELGARVRREGRPVLAPCDGYVRSIDEEGLMRFAAKHNLAIALGRRPGHFVVEGGELGRVFPVDAIDDRDLDRIAGWVPLGPTRALGQDLEFAIEQLVEIGLRALSSGINDPFTAIGCIDRLSASLSRLARRRFPPPVRRDESGTILLFVQPLSFRGVIDAAFDQLRQIARGNVAVTIRLLESLARIVAATPDPEARKALLRQAAMIENAARDVSIEDSDRREIESCCARVRAAESVLALVTIPKAISGIGGTSGRS